jgi:hypothetical protein
VEFVPVKILFPHDHPATIVVKYLFQKLVNAADPKEFSWELGILNAADGD